MGKFREKLQRFMIGRYGMDQLNQFLLYAVLAVILINLFVRVWPLEVLELAGIVFLYFRMFSRNISKRYQENQAFLRMSFRVREPLKNGSSAFGRAGSTTFTSAPAAARRSAFQGGAAE